jgi:23S rRNA pseudouridine1911/1915/1917 synthase
MKEIELIVTAGAGERTDRYLTERARVATRSQVQRLVRAGLVLVDGSPAKASHKLRRGQTIRVTVPEPEPSAVEAEPIPLDVVYEDRYLVVVNKPAGMVVHPGAGVRRGTLVNALLAHCKDLSGIGGVVRPGIVHRLDKDTTGLMIVAKDDATHLALSAALARREIKRTYEAVVWGVPARGEATIETLVGRSHRDRKKMAVVERSGRQAVTVYRTVEQFEFASRLVINLATGRTHQIRVHLAHLGHPVFGDPTYGGRRRSYPGLGVTVMGRARRLLETIDRQALHARRLGFVHPASRRTVELEAPLPADMAGLVEALRAEVR